MVNVFNFHLKLQQYFILLRQICRINSNLWNLLFLKDGYDTMELALATQIRAIIELKKKVV